VRALLLVIDRKNIEANTRSTSPVFQLGGGGLMARVFITGSADGLGRAAARSLLDEGHEVVLHARSTERASTPADLASQAAGVAIGDLRSAAEVHRVAEQVNSIGRMNAVIHNAGIYRAPSRGFTPKGHGDILAVNTLAPFMLTALIGRPDRLVYLSSGLHRGGEAP
jgi:NAD(P)-dependent dehydrogenase (short-subunit alcohol dehydrogenase family)